MATVLSLNVNGCRDMGKVSKILKLYESDIMCIQETHWDEGIIEKVKERWKGGLYYTNGAGNARGVAILLNVDRVGNIKQVYKDSRGRIVSIEFDYMDRRFRLVNVYMPVVEGEKGGVICELKPLCTPNCIVTGDFNTKLSRLDVGKDSEFRGEKSRKMLIDMMDEGNLVDVWRYYNIDKREYSRRQVREGELKQSRIDFVLVKEDTMRFIDGIRYEFNTLSDHAALLFKIRGRRGEGGGGYWIMNESLMEDKQFHGQVRQLLMDKLDYINSIEEDSIDVGEWWEAIKEEVKMMSIRHARKSGRKQREKEMKLRVDLNRELSKAEDEPGYSIEGFLRVRAKLARFEKEKCRGAILRSKARYTLEGERCTAFFLGQEKRKQSRTYISEVVDGTGKTVGDYVEVLETVTQYFTELFRKGEVVEHSMTTVLENINCRIGLADRETCEGDITESEIQMAIEGLKGGKSPGSDGLGGGFYKMYRDVLGPILLKVYGYVERSRRLPRTMGLGVVTLIYKNKGSKLELENYRPISVLNNDYKLLTRVFANRLKEVVGKVIGASQSYSIPGRDIADNISTIREVIKFMKHDGKGGIVASVDLSKAFDRVEHDFLFKTLEGFGFGERMVGWIRCIYAEARSCVKINGVLTDSFRLERSVRQGCPLSPILYALSVEPMINMIRNDIGIKGIELEPGQIVKISSYADDTTIMVRDKGSIERALELIDTYGKAAGARVNIGKSEVMYIGNVERSGIGFRVREDCINMLGVYLGIRETLGRDLTWTGVLNKMKGVCGRWRKRSLKLKGKVVIVNSLVMSVCGYVLRVLDMPEWVKKELLQIIVDFLWEGKGVRIGYKTLIGKINQGGLKLADLGIRQKAMRIQTVIRYLYGEGKHGWKVIFKQQLQRFGGMGDSFLLMRSKRTMTVGMSEVFKEVLEAWGDLMENIDYECEGLKDIINQPLFMNRKIRYNNKEVYYKLLYDAGIRQVKDVMYEVIPGFLRVECIYDSVCEVQEEASWKGIESIYSRIKVSIPERWRHIIDRDIVKEKTKQIPNLYLVKGCWRKSLREVTSKNIHDLLIEKEFMAPAAERVWGEVFPQLEKKNIWASLNVSYNSLECENSDFMMRHNRIYTKVVLHKINNDISGDCDVCNSGHETFLHYFFECRELQGFFVYLKQLLATHCQLDKKDLMDWKIIFLFTSPYSGLQKF